MGLISNVKEEIRIIRERDPAIHSSMEVFLYPSFKVMLHYRLAHKLYLSGHYFLARWISPSGACARQGSRSIRAHRSVKASSLTMETGSLSERRR